MGFVSDRVGRKYTLVLLFTWIGVGFVLFQFVGASLLTLVLVQLFTGLAINGVYPISASGGYSSNAGFLSGLYFIAAVMFVTAVLILLFTRETIGRMYAQDRALVSRGSCLKGRQMQ